MVQLSGLDIATSLNFACDLWNFPPDSGTRNLTLTFSLTPNVKNHTSKLHLISFVIGSVIKFKGCAKYCLLQSTRKLVKCMRERKLAIRKPNFFRVCSRASEGTCIHSG